jgi:hypothetical protein
VRAPGAGLGAYLPFEVQVRQADRGGSWARACSSVRKGGLRTSRQESYRSDSVAWIPGSAALDVRAACHVRQMQGDRHRQRDQEVLMN